MLAAQPEYDLANQREAVRLLHCEPETIRAHLLSEWKLLALDADDLPAAIADAAAIACDELRALALHAYVNHACVGDA